MIQKLKQLRFHRLVPVILAVGSGAVLFVTAQEVQQRRGQLAELQDKLKREREAVRVLSAEWAWLNRPQRLEALAKAHLRDMQPPSGAQMLPRGAPLPTIMEPDLPPVKPDDRPHIQPAAGGDDEKGRNTGRDADNQRFDAMLRGLKTSREAGR